MLETSDGDNRHMAFWTKRRPCVPSTFTTPECNRVNNQNIFFMFFVEPVVLFAMLIAVNCYCLNLRLKLAVLSLKQRHLAFKIGSVINGKRESLSEDIGDRKSDDGGSGCVENRHGGFFEYRDLLHGDAISVDGCKYYVVCTAVVCRVFANDTDQSVVSFD